MKRLFVSSLLGLAALSTSTYGTITILLDDFSNDFGGSTLLEVSEGGPTTSNDVGTLNIGGPVDGSSRTATFSFLGKTDVATSAIAYTFTNSVTVDNDDGVSTRLTVDYDFSPLPGGELDGAGALNNQVEITLIQNDDIKNPSLTLSFNGGTAVSVPLAQRGAGLGGVPIKVPFGDFGVDFSQLTSAQLILTSDTNDARLGPIGFGFDATPVPEPSSALLAMLGLGAFATRRRR